MKTNAKQTIHIEATALSRAKRTGVDYLAEGLIRPLVADNPHVEFVFFRFQEDGEKLHISGDNVREIIITKMSAKVYRLRRMLGLAPSLESLIGEEPRKIIYPNFSMWPMRSKTAKTYAMVPDTVFLDHPEYLAGGLFRQYLKRSVAYTARHATNILTCSQTSKQSIQKYFGVSPEHIHVLYPGYSLPKSGKQKSSIKIPKDFILFVGTLEPRKNIASLIKAYVGLPEVLRKRYPLVLAGGKGWRDEEIQELIERHRAAGVMALGYVNEATREALYDQATIFAYPAIYEGFGMPIVEAQAHGVPVLTARNTSLPEAAGDAAEYVSTDPEGIRDGLERLLTDAAVRRHLSQAGKTHAAGFTWERSVKQLQKLLDLG